MLRIAKIKVQKAQQKAWKHFMTTSSLPQRITANAVWISDVHLGYKDCKADYLLDFLDRLECNTLYLVGDIIDMWSLSKNFHWPEQHNKIVKKLIDMAKHDCRVIYIPGNHDQNFRDFSGEKFGAIEIHQQYIHTTADQRKLLIMHGDELDHVIRFNRFIHIIGDHAYDLLLFISRLNNHIRKYFGYNYWSLGKYIKTHVKNAQNAITAYENAAMELAQNQGLDGVVCGHIHQANIRFQDNILYCNDGDWVESCTFLLEDKHGWLELMHWSDQCKTEHVVNLFDVDSSDKKSHGNKAA